MSPIVTRAEGRPPACCAIRRFPTFERRPTLYVDLDIVGAATPSAPSAGSRMRRFRAPRDGDRRLGVLGMPCRAWLGSSTRDECGATSRATASAAALRALSSMPSTVDLRACTSCCPGRDPPTVGMPDAAGKQTQPSQSGIGQWPVEDLLAAAGCG